MIYYHIWTISPSDLIPMLWSNPSTLSQKSKFDICWKYLSRFWAILKLSWPGIYFGVAKEDHISKMLFISQKSIKIMLQRLKLVSDKSYWISNPCKNCKCTFLDPRLLDILQTNIINIGTMTCTLEPFIIMTFSMHGWITTKNMSHFQWYDIKNRLKFGALKTIFTVEFVKMFLKNLTIMSVILKAQ